MKVPYPFLLVSLALIAGKHACREWPISKRLDEAQKLAALADANGIAAVAGTRARAAPEARHLKALDRPWEGRASPIVAVCDVLGHFGTLTEPRTGRLISFENDGAERALQVAANLSHALVV